RWLEEDLQRVAQLQASAKDRAENVMIVDLLRNDLGKVCEFGSVEVPELFAVERVTRALQMTSTVTGTRREGVGLVDVFKALFPCGSVTGAPKGRTMEIISELEGAPRGMYTGAIGFIAPGGDAIFNVAIRTLVIDARTGTATLNVGGGITWDSVTTSEFEEARLKARFLTDRWPEFDLLETIELADGKYTLLERHLARARDSATYFGFHWDETKIAAALDAACESHPVGRWRVRLTSDRTGRASVVAVRLHDLRKPLTVRFATSPVDDLDPLLFHKTTARARYTDEIARCAPCDDVIFWNARGEVTESSIANIVISSDGKQWTPPRECGLLAGTLRNELIARGELFERVITKEELARSGSFALINSVRGRMDAVLNAAGDP
ncbi:MAG TPA: chorismate-binding protein, partial [Gemmatimonadaceae bacterium]|nr:chorismate-binding protein [Gemmatimonadaceae bacterium]